MVMHNDWPDLEQDDYYLSPYADVAMNVLLDELPWSPRCYNAFYALKLKFVGDLCAKTKRELLLARNFGRTSLDEVEQMLLQKNMQLGMYVERNGKTQR